MSYYNKVMTKNPILKRLALTLSLLASSTIAPSCNDGSCQNDMDCPGDKICIEEICKLENNQPTNPNNEQKFGTVQHNRQNYQYINVMVRHGLTDNKGRLSFEEYYEPRHPDEPVQIELVNENNNPINQKMHVTYFDHENAECFFIRTQHGFNTFQDCFDHNSKHILKLAHSAFKLLNSTSENALNRQQYFLTQAGTYRGCLNKEEINNLANANGYIIKKSGFLSFLGINENKFNKAKEAVLNEFNSGDNVAHVHLYTFNPNLTSSITSVQIDRKREEDCSTPIDDNCDGVKNEGCSQNDCALTNEYTCVGNEKWTKDSCDNPVRYVRECDDGCNDGTCLDNNNPPPNCQPTNNVTCHNGDLYKLDSCGNRNGIEEICASDICENSRCIDEPNNPQERIRFVDNGNGTVTDNGNGYVATGQRRVKVWQKTPDEFLTWQNAIENCQDLDLGGSNNWTLPPSSELARLIDIEENCLISSALNGRCGDYWSSTTQSSAGREQCTANEKIAVPFSNNDRARSHCQDEEQPLHGRCLKN